MSTLRTYVDQNQSDHFIATTNVTDLNQHEVRCAMCARELYVDDEGYRLYMESLDSGSDNPFVCEICDDDY